MPPRAQVLAPYQWVLIWNMLNTFLSPKPRDSDSQVWDGAWGPAYMYTHTLTHSPVNLVKLIGLRSH